jgi:putative nucleotide binding protein
MAEQSANEEWVRVLAERPPDRDEEDSRYVQAVGESEFTLRELVPAENVDLTPGDRVAVESEKISRVTQSLTYQTLTQDAQDRLKETITAIISENEQRFIEYYNNAQPIGLRQHQLDFLPEIGDTRRDAIIDERKLEPFDDFADLETRVDSLSNPQTLLVDRVLTELRERNDARYKLLVN